MGNVLQQTIKDYYTVKIRKNNTTVLYTLEILLKFHKARMPYELNTIYYSQAGNITPTLRITLINFFDTSIR